MSDFGYCVSSIILCGCTITCLSLSACSDSSTASSGLLINDGGASLDASTSFDGSLADSPSDSSNTHLDSSVVEGSTDSGNAKDSHADTGEGAEDAPSSDSHQDAPSCTTTITYGSAWIHGTSHPDNTDVATDKVTWDGTCIDDGGNSYAILSNGWKPYFEGNSSCVIALDYANCTTQPPSCETRVSYGAHWLPGPNHPNQYDDVSGEVLWSGSCVSSGTSTYAQLSNGWTPYFSGACQLSFRYSQCKGLYANPVVDTDCPDPGVLYDNGQYVMVCTGYLFPMRVSSNLVDWTPKGTIFTASTKPTWAQGNFWAPEIHKVGSHYVAYFTATFTDGKLSIGAASADSPTGPFNDIGKPLLHDSNMGLIDPSFIETNGKRYVIWKEDGNAVGKKTPIHSQELAADGLSVIGTASTLITNDQTWEGALVEGPWMIEHGGMYYLFYSANGYTSPQYAIGVARSSSPTSGFAKHPGPIVSTTNPWVGPGHNSVVHTPAGADYIVYHSWKQGQVGGGVGRVVLVDRIEWSNGWPSILSAPSHVSLPLPQ